MLKLKENVLIFARIAIILYLVPVRRIDDV